MHHVVADLAKRDARFIRLQTTGDFYKPDGLGGYTTDLEYVADVIAFCKANPHRLVWTYTHDIRRFVADTGLSYIAGNIPPNFFLLASTEDDETKAWAHAHGFRTARVIKTEPERASDEIFCPYDRALHHGKTGKEISVRCVTCQLCWKAPEGKHIAFLQH
jgi:hypothetical protein